MELLTVDKITKKFGGLTAINQLTFNLAQGDILSLIGPNGAGKTTVFNVITGFIPADMGFVKFNGHPITHLQPFQICHLGLVRTFQIVQPFYDLTTLENVMIAAFNRNVKLSDSKYHAEMILDKMGMSSLKLNRANSLTLADRKRLELAKALATEPKVILLDEVMAGLTPKETIDFIDLIKSLNQEGFTFLIIEHVIKAVLELSNNVIVINYGTKIAEGNPHVVLKDKGVIEAYLGKERSFDRSKQA